MRLTPIDATAPELAVARRFIAIPCLLFAAGCFAESEAESPAESAARARADSATAAESAFLAQLDRQWDLAQVGTHTLPPSAARNPAIPPGDPQPGVRPTIRFTADSAGFGGRSFCNGYGGPYVLRGDSLRIVSIESSAVGCDGPDSLETRLFRALRETRRFELDSARLHLIADDGTRLMFVPSPP